MASSSSKFQRGSEWRKWDLHVHTPASYDWDSKCKKSVEEIIDAAVAEGLSAVAITDHHSVASVDQAVAYGKRKGLYVIPGVELRTEQGNDKIHLIGLFPDAIPAKTIHEKVLCPLGFSDADIRDKGDEQVYCTFKTACELIHDLGGLAFLHAGSKSNGIEQLDSDTKKLLKTDLAHMVDIFEVNASKQAKDYRDIVFPVIEREFPCLTTSDSVDRSKFEYGGHSIEVIGKAYSWIKADTNFEGLRQLLHEPQERVYIGPTPPTSIDDSKVIDRVEFLNANDWFEETIVPLNTGLVGVIGEKGSGKTALAELIAFGAYAWNDGAGSSSFISKAKPHTTGMTVRLHWRDGHQTEAVLHKPLPGSAEVRYLSQDFVEELCSKDLSGLNLIKSIEGVVFSHVDETDRLDASSFAELKQLKTESLTTKKTAIKSQMVRLNSEIVALEDQVASKGGKERQLKKCDVDIEAIDKQLPSLKGSVDPKIEKELERLSKLLKEKNDALATINRSSRVLQVVKAEAETFIEDVEQSFESLKERLEEAGLTSAEIAAFAPNFKGDRTKPFDRIAIKQSETAEALRGTPSKPNLTGETIADLTIRIAELQKSLATDEKERERLLALQKQRAQSVAEKERLQKEIAKIDNATAELLQKKRTLRLKTYLSYFSVLDDEEKTLKDLYEPLKAVIADDPTGAKAGFELNVEQMVDSEGWLAAGRTLFDGRKKLPVLYEKDALDSLEATLFSSWKSRDLKAIQAAIEAFMLEISATPEDLDGLLNSHTNREKVYAWLFDTDHTRLEYSLRYNGTELHVLSPGTRGIVLLVLYLAMDTQDTRPLIIDQPEGNLDNASVYDALVPYLRTAKKIRQIILVTHNPNLIVTTDADQVIVARAERAKGANHPKLLYTTGSLEDTGTADAIREQAIKLLEGGSKPFKQRGNRYDLP